MIEECDLSIIIGKKFSSVTRDDDNDQILFNSEEEEYLLCHRQQCCESVYIEDVCGNLQDLIGSEILQAEEVCNSDLPSLHDDGSYTWTFYKLATIKGYVTIRFYGTSNGFYSESASFYKTIKT